MYLVFIYQGHSEYGGLNDLAGTCAEITLDSITPIIQNFVYDSMRDDGFKYFTGFWTGFIFVQIIDGCNPDLRFGFDLFISDSYDKDLGRNIYKVEISEHKLYVPCGPDLILPFVPGAQDEDWALRLGINLKNARIKYE